jgi:glycosyltransferase involved in cell wall biosynthesis
MMHVRERTEAGGVIATHHAPRTFSPRVDRAVPEPPRASAAREGVSMNIAVMLASLRGGGTERVVSLLSARWAADGHHVTVMTLDRSPDFYALAPAVARVTVRERSNPWCGRAVSRLAALRRAIQSSNPDVLVSMIHKTNVAVVAATRGLDVPVVVSEQTNPESAALSPKWRAARRVAYALADAVVVLTPEAARWAAPYVAPSRLAVVPNPVRPPAPSTPVEHRRPALVAVGRLQPYKGFDLLLRAFALTRAANPEWTLYLYGSGPEDGRLRGLVAELGLGSCVHLPGATGAVDSVLQAGDLFVLPSRHEGFPMVILEAMANGCPVAAFDCESGPRNVITDGVDGVLVPPADVAALARAMSRLMADRDERARLAAAARRSVARFSMDAVSERWMAVMRTAIERRNGRVR